MPEHATLVGVWAGEVASGARAASPLVLDDTVAFVPGTVRSLDEFMGSDGRLRWSAPAGRWHIVAVFAGPAGDALTLSAERPHGLSVDHLDARAVRAEAERWIPATEVPAAANGLFSDSLEFKVDRLFTDDFLEQFELRRGYPLAERILAVLAQSADSFLLDAGRVEVAPELSLGAEDERVRWDYRETVSELFVERYVENLRSVANERGLVFRSQSYGIDVDVIGALGAADVPEVESLYAGGSRLFLELASSAAEQMERPVVSAEAFSFILRDHMTTPLKVRAASDVLFSAGVNQLVFHGYPYDAPGEYGVPGWTPFSSPYGGATTFGSTFGERWEFFEWIRELTDYVARTQSLLRQGSGGADVLVLLPFHGFPTSLALSESWDEPLLGGHIPEVEARTREVPFSDLAALLGPPVEDERVTWLVQIGGLLERLASCGQTWSWVNPDNLLMAESDGSGLRVGGARYERLVLYATPEVELRVAEKLAELAAQGTEIIFIGEAPSRSPSYGERSHDARIDGLIREAGSRASARAFGDPGDAFEALAQRASAASTACGGTQRAFWRAGTHHASLSTVFISNPTPGDATATWSLEGCDAPVVYDAFRHEWSDFEGSLSLGPYDARIVVCGADVAGVPSAPTWRSEPGDSPQSRTIAPWRIEARTLLEPGAEPVVVDVGEPVDWRQLPELASISGRADYTAAFDMESAGMPAVLSFEDVWGAGRVLVNGTHVGDLVVPPWRLDVTEALVAGENTITVDFAPPARNELLAAADAGDVHYAQLVDRADSAIASGIGGPVVLLLSTHAAQP
jgi:hypothetical protein